MLFIEFLATATAQLQSTGLSRAQAHNRARLLLDWASGERYAHLARPESRLDQKQQQILDAALQDLKKGRPLPYITGQQAFFGLDFQVDERVLIPRPETELLVETALKNLNSIESPRIADLGTGSGCIAISLATARHDAQIFASDLSNDALELATENAARLGAAIGFVAGQNGDWAAPIRKFAPFNAIISNPPYIAPLKIEQLQPEVRLFEPRWALDGGENGLDCYRQLAAQVGELLQADGFLALEVGAEQFGEVAQLLAAQNWHTEAPIFDLAGHARVLVARPG